MFNAIEILQTKLSDAGYIADKNLTTTLLLMEQLGRPLLIEGEAGVGKTEIASEAFAFHTRLFCVTGLYRERSLEFNETTP